MLKLHFQLEIIFIALLPFCSATLCSTEKFVECQLKFAENLSIDSSYNWLNPLGLTLQIQDIYINGGVGGQRGINAVCNAYNQFVQCISDSGSTTFECFNIGWIMKHISAPSKAYSYSFLMNMLQYQCGAGFYIASDNWKCLQQIYNGNNATMYKCITDFVLSAQEDPARGCNYVQNGMNCFQNAAQLGGCPDELKYYGCESFRQYSIPQFSRCQKECDVDTTFR